VAQTASDHGRDEAEVDVEEMAAGTQQQILQMAIPTPRMYVMTQYPAQERIWVSIASLRTPRGPLESGLWVREVGEDGAFVFLGGG